MARYCANSNPMVDNEKIKAEMKRQGYTQKSLGDEIGVSRHSMMSHLRNGDWSVLAAYKVSKVLGLNFEEVFFAHPEEVA